MINYSPKIYAKALFSLFKEGKLNFQAFKNFLEILLRNNQLKILPMILKEFEKFYKKDLKILEVSVFLPKKLKEEEIELLKEKIKERYQPSKIILKEIIDENLIGGLKLKIEDEIIDGSIRNSLSKLERILLK